MGIKKKIQAFKYYIRGRNNRYTRISLCGVSLNVLPGVYRSQVDQDDAWWFYLSKNHNVIFDIGCNIGYTALLGLIQNPNKQIVLVDPNPIALQQAAVNIINNGLGSRAQYQAAFVSNKLDQTVTFYTVGSGAAGSMHASHAQTAASLNSSLQVKTVTLDYLFNFYDLKPSLIKIDVEGAETLVMEGAKELAKETSCTFFIEMHDVENMGMKAAGQFMLNWCKEMAYHAWYLKTGELLETAVTIKDRGKCHLLLLPNSKDYPDYLKNIPQNAPLPKTI
ncbi:FkbM family methyltransferase [Bizionia sp.]|uniref:FkbM family methyltransferase n=1 Tax=Bizionia sp. TaxID=1954480 RepID=UPI003A912A28